MDAFAYISELESRAEALREIKKAATRELLSIRRLLKSCAGGQQGSLLGDGDHRTPTRMRTDGLMRAALGLDATVASTSTDDVAEHAAPAATTKAPVDALLLALDGEWRTRGDLEKRAGSALPEGAFPKLMQKLLDEQLAEHNDGQKRAKKYRLARREGA